MADMEAIAREGTNAMPKDSISKTAQVNLNMLTFLGVPEAVAFSKALQLEGNPLVALQALPFAHQLPLCISCISEVLYESANQLILEANNPTILDVACGYSPRVLKMAPRGYTYIGADLPDVIGDLTARRRDILPADEEWIAGYRTVNAADEEQMRNVLGGLREPITVVTQALLPYLSLEEKTIMASSIRELLQRDGGCWIIPDADPDSLMRDTFRAVLGKVATSIVRSVKAIHSKAVGRNRSKMSWRNVNEIEEALANLGFSVRRVPLYREGMELNCLKFAGEEAADKLRTCWQQKNSLVVTAE